MKGGLLRLCYFSASRSEDRPGLAALVEQSRRDNAMNGITGILLHHDRAFSHMLEGERAAVEALMAKIERDLRHDSIAELYRISCDERLFAPWPMAFLEQESYSRPDASSDVPALAAVKRCYREAGAPADRLLRKFFLGE